MLKINKNINSNKHSVLKYVLQAFKTYQIQVTAETIYFLDNVIIF